MGAHIEIRPLSAADALACDAIVASLAYHFANEEGRAEAAAKVRTQPGLVAVVDGAVAGFLTVERHFDHAAEISWMAVHADHRRRGSGTCWWSGSAVTWPPRGGESCWSSPSRPATPERSRPTATRRPGPSTGRSASSWPGTCQGCGPATPP
jgi:GNAT superfamily N-acetyltransferase